MNPHDQALELIQRYADGLASAEDTRQLAELLRADAMLRERFLEYLNVDLALEEHAVIATRGTEAAPVAPVSLRRSSRRRFLHWCAAAASGVAAAAAGTWLVFSARHASADDVLDGLIDWDLQLTHAPSPADRQRIYDSKGEQLRTLVARTKFVGEQGTIAEELLEDGRWLAGNSDPVAGAARFDGLADRLLKTACDATAAGDHRRARRRMEQYNRVLEAGVNLNLDRAESSGVLDLDRQGKLERFALGDPERIKRLTALLEASPDASRDEIRRALGTHHKHAKRLHKRANRGARKANKRSPSSSAPAKTAEEVKPAQE